MKLIKILAGIGKAGLFSALLFLSGCPKNNLNNHPTKPFKGTQETHQTTKEEIPKGYFLEIKNLANLTGVCTDFEDINGDGNKDYIITAYGYKYNLYYIRTYKFLSDGKGNFTSGKYYDKDIQKVE